MKYITRALRERFLEAKMSRVKGLCDLLDAYRFSAAPPPPPAPSAPLDGFTTGLWAAYGLFLLLSAYSGSLVRVRRSSDNTELDIGVVSNKLDLSALLAFVGAGDGFITKWYDQKAGNDFAQATQAAQPQIVASGVYINGVKFNGTSDVLSTAASITATPQMSIFTNMVKGAGSGTEAYLSNDNVATSGFNGFEFYSDASSTDMSSFIGQNGVSSFGIYAYPLAGMRVQSVFGQIYDRSAAANLQANGYKNGILQTVIPSSFGSFVPSGNFSVDTISAGGTGGGSFSSAKVGNMAIYLDDQTSNVLGISQALDYDPFNAEVEFRMHYEGLTFVDSSLNNHTINVVPSAALSATQAKFGTQSLGLPGSGAEIELSINSFDFRSAPWTCEQWVFFVGIPSFAPLMNFGASGSDLYLVQIGTDFYLGDGLTNNIVVTISPPTGVWLNYAVTFDGTTYTFYLNGVVKAQTTSPLKSGVPCVRVEIGGWTGQGNYTTGFFDESRFTPGVDRYGGVSFTPLPWAFPDQ